MGIGIQNENLDKIFDEFYQEKAALSKNFEGAGLGLAISQKVLKLINSKIHVKSERGEGNEFSFTASFKFGGDIDTEENIFKRKNIQSDKQFMILIAEDNKINMMLTVKIISDAFPNAVIMEASNGKEVVKKFSENKVDIVLMDLQIPILNGYLAAEKMRELKTGKQVSIIGYIVGSIEEERSNDLGSNFDGYIEKPIDKHKMIQKIEDTIS